MGCYDTVVVNCPKCGREHYLQSKGGECLLKEYTLKNCPVDVLSDVNRHAPFNCECGVVFDIRLKCKGKVNEIV